MSGEDKSAIYKTLNDCVAALTGEVMTGTTAMYATVDRYKYNELLKAIVEAKKPYTDTSRARAGYRLRSPNRWCRYPSPLSTMMVGKNGLL